MDSSNIITAVMNALRILLDGVFEVMVMPNKDLLIGIAIIALVIELALKFIWDWDFGEYITCASFCLVAICAWYLYKGAVDLDMASRFVLIFVACFSGPAVGTCLGIVFGIISLVWKVIETFIIILYAILGRNYKKEMYDKRLKNEHTKNRIRREKMKERHEHYLELKDKADSGDILSRILVSFHIILKQIKS